MSTSLRALLCALALSTPFVAAAQPRAEKTRSPTAPAVTSHGALRKIFHEGATGTAVTLGELQPRTGTWAIGALSDLRGEVTVVDGVAWISVPGKDGKPKTQRSKRKDEGFALLVASTVPRWQSRSLSSAAPSLGELEALIASEVQRVHGADVPVAVRVEGKAKRLEWHVIDGSQLQPGAPGGHAAHVRASQRGVIENAKVTLVGFYSPEHQGVFTHMGARTHFHVVVTTGDGLSAHVDALELEPGATLHIAVNRPEPSLQ